jgi:uncharacterized protein (TIGR03067 family)
MNAEGASLRESPPGTLVLTDIRHRLSTGIVTPVPYHFGLSHSTVLGRDLVKRTFLTIGVVLLASAFSLRAEDDAVAKEDKKFEGTWEVIEFEANGEKVPKEVYANWTFTFKGKDYEQKDGDKVMEAGKQTLDPSKKPKHMDIAVAEGEAKGEKQLAIYEWDGDGKVKICASRHGETTRPEKFETKEDKGDMYFVLKRKTQ